MSSVSGIMNRILDSKITGLTVFALTGTGKLVSDYKEAPENRKDFVLLRDSLILGGSALGVGLYELSSMKLAKSKTVQNALKTIKTKASNVFEKSDFYQNKIKAKHSKTDKTAKFCLKQIKTVAKDCTDNMLMVGAGIFGAVGADYAIQRSHLEKNKHLRKLSAYEQNKIGDIYNFEDKLINKWENSSINRNFDNTVGSEVKSNIFSQITNMPAMKMFSKTMVGMQGFEVIEEKTFKDRMHHATKCLVSNSLIPLFFLSISSSLTKNMKSIFRLPIIFTSLVCGTMYTNKTIESGQNKKPNKKTDNAV